VSARVERALTEVGVGTPVLEPPDFESHRSDFLAGLPLLRRDPPLLSLEPAGRLTAALVANLAGDSGLLGGEARMLDEQLRDMAQAEAPRRVADWLMNDDSFTPSVPGLLRFLGWTAAARFLAPATAAFASWREGDLDERWLRRYCPLCGSPPAMAQLVVVDAGRKRLLACGACGSRWGYKRTKCPFCEADAEKLSSMKAEGEAGLRIDSCQSCRGYVKTYDGQGNEGLLLADWTSLHLDLLAQDRGLKRMANSLYELDSSSASAAAPS
jgi:FdhE protein